MRFILSSILFLLFLSCSMTLVRASESGAPVPKRRKTVTTKMAKASALTGGDWWNDSCTTAELSDAVSKGAVGSTSNPVILMQCVNAEKETWIPKIDELIAAHPEWTEIEIADELNDLVIADKAGILKPVHKETEGKKGYLSAQVNAQFYKSAEKMVEQGMRLYKAGGEDSNVMIKCPATPAGIAAMEELTYRGISINATLSFSVAQAVAAGAAVEKGIQRRKAEGLDCEKMGPVITVMVGRIDDACKKEVDKLKLTMDPGHLNWCGVAVMKKVWGIFQERGYTAKPLAAAYRCVFHWSELLGEHSVCSMPYKWWNQFDASDVEPRKSMTEEVAPVHMSAITKVPLFNQLYDENTPETDFVRFQPSKDTLHQFLSARDDILKFVRARMVDTA